MKISVFGTKTKSFQAWLLIALKYLHDQGYPIPNSRRRLSHLGLSRGCIIRAKAGDGVSPFIPTWVEQTPYDIPALHPKGIKMTLYHEASASIACTILENGFCDGPGSYRTKNGWRKGVWFSDDPLTYAGR